jgi:hypothetical protein
VLEPSAPGQRRFKVTPDPVLHGIGALRVDSDRVDRDRGGPITPLLSRASSASAPWSRRCPSQPPRRPTSESASAEYCGQGISNRRKRRVGVSHQSGAGWRHPADAGGRRAPSGAAIERFLDRKDSNNRTIAPGPDGPAPSIVQSRKCRVTATESRFGDSLQTPLKHASFGVTAADPAQTQHLLYYPGFSGQDPVPRQRPVPEPAVHAAVPVDQSSPRRSAARCRFCFPSRSAG